LIAGPAIFTWPVLVAQLLIFGTAAFALMFAPVAIGESNGASDRVVMLWRLLAMLNLAMSPLLFMEIASRMAQTGWMRVLPFIPQIMRETVAGRFWVWRFAAVVMLAMVVWIPARATLVAFATLTLSSLLIVLGSLTSHAIDKGAPVVAIYSVHQATAGLWLGALASLLMAARRGPDALAAFTPRVSTVCVWSVAIMVISGPLIALRWLGWNPHLLLDSAYGRTLMGKLATATPALLLGASNRYWQVPRVAQKSVRVVLIRSVVGECVLLLGVLAWSALLANTPPPH
jgi:putative copper export protein